MKTAKIFRVTDQNNKDLGEKAVQVDIDENGVLDSLVWDGQEYWPTGKDGKNIKTGRPVREMATENDERLWMSTDYRRQAFINLD